MIKRINFFGGPSTGKSETAAHVYAALSSRGFPVGLVDEAIKPMAWQRIEPKGFDQVWLFGKQLHREDVILRSGGLVVTGGPLYQQVTYMHMHADLFAAELTEIARQFEEVYPSLNIFLGRDVNIPYQPAGRYHTLAQAIEVDRAVLNCLSNCGLEVHAMGGYSDGMVQRIKEELLRQ